MDKKLLKNLGIALGAVLFFLVLSYAFVPQVLDGKIVNQSDISGYIGMSHEMSEWNAAHPDDPTYWTDAMFGGMPTTAISTQNGGDATQGIYNLLLTGKRPATYLFIALLGAFLLMLSLGISWPLAIGGAIAVAFCSYNFQIIQVGHNTIRRCRRSPSFRGCWPRSSIPTGASKARAAGLRKCSWARSCSAWR